MKQDLDGKVVFEAHDAVMHLPGRTMPRMLFHTDAVSSMMPICVKTFNWTKDRISRVCTRCPLLRTMPSRLTASTRTIMRVFSAPLPPHACLYSHQVHIGTPSQPCRPCFCGAARCGRLKPAQHKQPNPLSDVTRCELPVEMPWARKHGLPDFLLPGPI